MINDSDIAVSVFCTVYNHEDFLESCLNGFLKQKTDFAVEFLVHDDCSTDNSALIIQEYASKYPDKIIPIYEKENQFSKGVKISRDILMPIARGKYIATCEGDDYWSDELKLQLQYDYMEKHPECSMCVHNTLFHDVQGVNTDSYFNKWKKIHKLTGKDVFFGWNVHTSSYFRRKEVELSRPMFSYKYWFGDYSILTWAFSQGDVVALPYVMSVYNYNNTHGITYKKAISSTDRIIARDMERSLYLQEFDLATGNNYHDIISQRMSDIELSCYIVKMNSQIYSEDIEGARETAKRISTHPYFISHCKNMGLLKGIFFYLKYRNYCLYEVLKRRMMNGKNRSGGGIGQNSCFDYLPCLQS